MNTGDKVSNYVLGPQLGQGSFGKIFVVIDTRDNKIYAMKTEMKKAGRKSLEFESKVLERIRNIGYFPAFRDSGSLHDVHWLTLELIGPSLSSILKERPTHSFSLSTSLRISFKVFKAIKELHSLGFIHRDIKPANILLRAFDGEKCCLIDFGLVRVYRDQKTHEHLPPRHHTGFRGTRLFASINAHAYNDLSRRDDLISWMYLTIAIMKGSLPWQSETDHLVLLRMKLEFDLIAAVKDICPELSQIWSLILGLNFEETPDYDRIESILQQACEIRGIHEEDPYDFEEYLSNYKETLLKNISSINIENPADEIKKPKYINQKNNKNYPSNVPLLAGRKYSRELSTMQASELNEIDKLKCC